MEVLSRHCRYPILPTQNLQPLAYLTPLDATSRQAVIPKLTVSGLQPGAVRGGPGLERKRPRQGFLGILRGAAFSD